MTLLVVSSKGIGIGFVFLITSVRKLTDFSQVQCK